MKWHKHSLACFLRPVSERKFTSCAKRTKSSNKTMCKERCSLLPRHVFPGSYLSERVNPMALKVLHRDSCFLVCCTWVCQPQASEGYFWLHRTTQVVCHCPVSHPLSTVNDCLVNEPGVPRAWSPWDGFRVTPPTTPK